MERRPWVVTKHHRGLNITAWLIRLILFSAFALMAVLATDLRASATEYYLAPDGSDDAVGSVLQPWGSFDRALSQLEPGDVLTVSGGTYAERVKNARLEPATAEQPITVQAAPGERPVLKGLLWIRGMDHWRFDGINITWGNGDDDEHMVKLTDGVGWEFLNAEVWGARSFAAILVATTGGSEPTDWRIAGNCVHDTIPTNSAEQKERAVRRSVAARLVDPRGGGES